VFKAEMTPEHCTIVNIPIVVEKVCDTHKKEMCPKKRVRKKRYIEENICYCDKIVSPNKPDIIEC